MSSSIGGAGPDRDVLPHSHLDGWPAPPDEWTRLVTDTGVIPGMVARVASKGGGPAGIH